MKHCFKLLVAFVTLVSCGDDDSGDGHGGASAGGSDVGGTSHSGGNAGANESAGAGAGGTESGGSGGADPCQRPAVVCGCDLRASDGVCFEFHEPSFTPAYCVPALCPDGDFLDAGCPRQAVVGYCVGGTRDRSEIYYEDAAAGEAECIDTDGLWCPP